MMVLDGGVEPNLDNLAPKESLAKHHIHGSYLTEGYSLQSCNVKLALSR